MWKKTLINVCFSDFPLSNTVKLENVGSYLSVATPVLKTFRDKYRSFKHGKLTISGFRRNNNPVIGFQVALNLVETAPLNLPNYVAHSKYSCP